MKSRKAVIITVVLFVVVIVILLIFTRFREPEKTEVKTVDKVNSGTYLDRRGGFSFKIPDGLTLEDKAEYYALLKDGSETGLYIFSNSDLEISCAYDYLLALKGLRERMDFSLRDLKGSTSLFEASPGIEERKVNERDTAIESELIYLTGGKVLNGLTYYLNIDRRGIAVSAVSTNRPEEKMILDIVNSIEPITYQRTPELESKVSCKATEIYNLRLNIPEGWERKSTNNMTVISSPVESGSPYSGVKITIVKDQSLDNEFRVIDETLRDSNALYARALSQNPEISPLRKLEFRLASDQTNFNRGKENFEIAEINLKLVPSFTGEISTLPEYNLKGKLFATKVGTETISILVTGVEDISYQSALRVSEDLFKI